MVSDIAAITELQDAYNRRLAELTPDERADLARRELIHIATVEPEMAWVLPALAR